MDNGINIDELLLQIKNEPSNAEHYQELGKYYIRNKEFVSAIKALQNSLELNPDDGWTYMYICLLYTSPSPRD